MSASEAENSNLIPITIVNIHSQLSCITLTDEESFEGEQDGKLICCFPKVS